MITADTFRPDPNEITALRGLPFSGKTQKLVDELRALIAERETQTPAIQKLMEKSLKMDTEKAVEKITPLRVKQEVVNAKLAVKRQECFDAIIEDSREWVKTTTELAREKTNAHRDAVKTFEQKVKTAFNSDDAHRMISEGRAAGSKEVRQSKAERYAADKMASQADEAHKLLDREHYAKLVANGLAMSTGRPHVMPVEWYWKNVAIILPEILD